jgi:hypothetical protein
LLIFLKYRENTLAFYYAYYILRHIKNITEQTDGILLKAETGLRQVISEAAQWQVVLKKRG